MAMISKMRRLTNPGRRRRNGLISQVKKKLSPLQKMFFGTKRQRAAVRNSGSTSRARKGFFKKKSHASAVKLAYKTSMSQRRRSKRNVGSIITVWPKGTRSNPGRRKKYKRNEAKNRLVIINPGAKMAKGSGRVISGYGSTVMNRGRKRMATRRRRRVVNPRRRRIVNRRRRRNSGTRQGRSWSTYTRRTKKRNPGITRRRRTSRRRITNRRHYRRNPGMLTGTMGRVVGVVGGVAVTKLLCGFLPATFTTGFLNYFAIAAVAFAQGKLVSKFAKNEALGNDMMVGGLAYLTAKLLNDFFPSIGSYTGMSGMGLIGGSSFYVPQVNRGGSMGQFMIPPAISSYVAGAMPVPANKGVGSMRRTGRLM